MSTAHKLLMSLKELGANLQCRGEILRIEVRAGTLSPSILTKIQEHKAELIGLLSANNSRLIEPENDEQTAWLTACLMATGRWPEIEAEPNKLTPMLNLWHHAEKCSGEPSTCHGVTLEQMRFHILTDLPMEQRQQEWRYWLKRPKLFIIAAKDLSENLGI